MLDIEGINHVGIRISDKSLSVPFYEQLGFQFESDAGFEDGHPIIMRHPCGVVVNLLGPATKGVGSNILMDVDEKYAGITHFAVTVSSLDAAKAFTEANNIAITGNFSFKGMSAIFIRDPDRNVIEIDAYDGSAGDGSGYSGHE
jgi:lactoylglutathione lyase